MSQTPNYASLLKEWLPAVWRERDDSGDLGRLLSVYGELLDAFHATVEQRLFDNFPDKTQDGRYCQDWLLPYFAQLLDVRLVSSDEAGRRAELADAVAWRQRKGTRVSIEKIAEAVGRFEVEVQEGWQRVAVTPRVDRPLLPEAAWGEAAIPADAGPAERARHPGLPAATLDLRYCSRAVQCEANHPGAHLTNFGSESITWRQSHHHGVPASPDSFQDVSRRTVDLRTPDGKRGLHHPRRVPLYFPPPEGHCSARAPSMHWRELAGLDSFDGEHVRLSTTSIQWHGRTLPLITFTGKGPVPVKMRGVMAFTRPAVYRFTNLWLDNRVDISAGAVQLAGCAVRQLRVATVDRHRPVIEARACLIKTMEAARGLVRLEYATVLETLLAECLEASDSILMPPLRKDRVDDDVPGAGCIRYSRLFHIPTAAGLPDPLWLSQGRRSALRCFGPSCSTERPLFWSEVFGQPGCGVLHPDCDGVFQTGAEDGGEMGACHDFRHVLRQKSVLEKLQEFLPVGMEAVLVADASLTFVPPKNVT